MATFFRHRIAQKVVSLLQNREAVRVPINANIIASRIRINKQSSLVPEFWLHWGAIETACKGAEISISPNELVKLLRNQGLPTAEGFVDIRYHQEYPLLVFAVDKHVFSKLVLVDIATNEGNLNKDDCLFSDVKKNIVIQCSVPGIGERCHMTHFRSAIRSQFLTNLNRYAGHNVKQVMHVNDWGPDAATLFTGYNRFRTQDQFAEESALNLFKVMKSSRFHSQNDFEFKKKVQYTYEKMEKGDSEFLSGWEDIKCLYMSYYNKIYKKIGVHFDGIHFDSSSSKEIEKLSVELLDKNFFTEKNNFVTLNCPVKLQLKYSYWDELANCDASIYHISRCLYAAIDMQKMYKFDKMYYVGPETDTKFNLALFHILKELGYPWAENLNELSLSLIKDLQTMGLGPKPTIEEVLNNIKQRIQTDFKKNLNVKGSEFPVEIAEQIALSALIFNDFKEKKNNYCSYHKGTIVNFGPYTGIAFQLLYAGLKGLQEESEYKFKDDIDTSPLSERSVISLLLLLAKFDEIMYTCYRIQDSQPLHFYLIGLQFRINAVLKEVSLDIKEERLRVIKARLFLLSATMKILAKSLQIMGITPLENLNSGLESFVQRKSFVERN